MSSIVRFLAKPPVEAFPLIAAVGVGCCYGVFLSYRNITSNPDVNLMKSDAWTKQEMALENLKTERLRRSGALPPRE